MSLKIVMPAPRRTASSSGSAARHAWKRLPPMPVVGLVDNVKTGADRMLNAIGARLVARKMAASHFVWQKPTTSHAITNDERANLLARAHVIISGIGD